MEQHLNGFNWMTAFLHVEIDSTNETDFDRWGISVRPTFTIRAVLQ